LNPPLPRHLSNKKTLILPNVLFQEGIMLGYSSISKGYKCYNKRIHKIIESIDVKVDEGALHLVRYQHHNEKYDEPINNELQDDGMGEK
jgi:hypothetical protein